MSDSFNCTHFLFRIMVVSCGNVPLKVNLWLVSEKYSYSVVVLTAFSKKADFKSKRYEIGKYFTPIKHI